jgi:hypothetical protein
VLLNVKGREEMKGIKTVGVVMTGELCDCFKTRKEGVLYLKNVVSDTFGRVKFFNTDCVFKNSFNVDRNPLSFSSTNWLASAKFISEEYKDVIFVDLGSTTTDVIPIVGGEIKANKTDFGRLKNGELIYSGILRTAIPSLLEKVKIGGEKCRTCSEVFAITADAYYLLGCITKEDYTCESPNHYAFTTEEDKKEEKSRISAMRRLARVVCSDPEEIGEDGAMCIAEQVKKAQLNELIASMERIKDRYGLEEVVLTGIGDFLTKEASFALNIDFLSLSSRYGKEISAAFPAYSVAKLLEESFFKKCEL